MPELLDVSRAERTGNKLAVTRAAHELMKKIIAPLHKNLHSAGPVTDVSKKSAFILINHQCPVTHFTPSKKGLDLHKLNKFMIAIRFQTVLLLCIL